MRARAAIGYGLVVLVAFVLLALVVGCEPQDGFSRDCKARGGVVHTHHRGNTTSRTCDPRPLPQPQPNWQ
jgi:hypothetical protein